MRKAIFSVAVTSLAAAGGPAVRLVGPRENDLQGALRQLDVTSPVLEPAKWTTAGRADEHDSPLALCSPSYPEPTRLSVTDAEALERFVAEGGRAYVEYAVREDGKPLFGIAVSPEVRRAQHQRLFVTGDLHPISGLKHGDILEEHNSACVTPHLLLQAWWAYCATGDERCLEAFHGIGDYLVRIQVESDDPRIDDAWMRGFDAERWEVYGAPYDPAYGPYSAYMGWMNAFASAAFAQYLMKADALPPSPPLAGRAAEVLAEVRAERSSRPRPANIVRGATYEFSPAPGGRGRSALRGGTLNLLPGSDRGLVRRRSGQPAEGRERRLRPAPGGASSAWTRL